MKNSKKEAARIENASTGDVSATVETKAKLKEAKALVEAAKKAARDGKKEIKLLKKQLKRAKKKDVYKGRKLGKAKKDHAPAVTPQGL